MQFYDVKSKQKVDVSNYQMVKKETKKGRSITMAKAKSPISGIMMYRILSNKKN